MTASFEATGETKGILVISPFPEDHEFLKKMLDDSGVFVRHAWDLWGAEGQLKACSFALVVSETRFADGRWEDLFPLLESQRRPPLLIVVSRSPGERLWSEVLNRCGVDVLAKPFRRDEAIRIIQDALEYSIFTNTESSGCQLEPLDCAAESSEGG
jgi:DNA-binding NtrC family response regulator